MASTFSLSSYAADARLNSAPVGDPIDAAFMFYGDVDENGETKDDGEPRDLYAATPLDVGIDESAIHWPTRPPSCIDRQRYAIHLQFEFPAMSVKTFMPYLAKAQTTNSQYIEIPVNEDALQNYMAHIRNITGTDERSSFTFVPSSIFVTGVMNKGLGVEVCASLQSSYFSTNGNEDNWRDWFTRTQFVNSEPLPVEPTSNHKRSSALTTGFVLYDGVSGPLHMQTHPAMHVYQAPSVESSCRQDIPYAMMGSNMQRRAKDLLDQQAFKIENVSTIAAPNDPLAHFLLSRDDEERRELKLQLIRKGHNQVDLIASPTAVARLLSMYESRYVKESMHLMRLRTLKVRFAPMSGTWGSVHGRLKSVHEHSHQLVHLGIRLCVEGYVVKSPH